MGQHYTLKRLHDHGCQCNRPVVVKSHDLGIFGNWDDGGGRQAGGHMAYLQSGVKDIGKYWR